MSQPNVQAAENAKKENRWRQTLNLPKTDFAMKANLIQNEPASMKRWAEMDLYAQLRARAKAKHKGRFVFHDGPPYANGSIHLGHLLNKCLKDFVVRSRSMMGFDVPFVPGWDCHGLPIEHKVMQELAEKGKLAKLATLPDEQRKLIVRKECDTYAHKYQKLQAGQMQRLLTVADYGHPYMTLQPDVEAGVLEVLATLVEQGVVFRAGKPVHWSTVNETALAEAELEYEDRVDVSVFVDFEAADADAVYDAFGLPREDGDDGDDEDTHAEKVRAPKPGTRPAQRPTLTIWTTTPWTLPANLAIAVNPKFRYALVWIDGNVTVMAEKLIEAVTTKAKSQDVVVHATTSGDRLTGLRYRHPLLDVPQSMPDGSSTGDIWRVVGADYVTLEDGTGLVHTAPGHGTEDFATGKRENLAPYCPVLANGTYDHTTPDWLRGRDIFQANDDIVQRLRNSGHLMHDERFTHSYPHDWRSKTPVIFRVTEQWFIGVDLPLNRGGRSLREMGIGAVERDITFYPEWGRNRLRGMLESRPDWCISRQRAWGLPIPAFFLPADDGRGKAVMTAASVRAVSTVVRAKGSDAWFNAKPSELLAGWDHQSDPQLDAGTRAEIRSLAASARLDELKKAPDILDVWFESGSTWHAVMRHRSADPARPDFPVEVYLEGADQHRGWFQSSLLPALGATASPPYKALLTHGFTVDKDGRKISKSDPRSKDYHVDTLLEKYGVDVLRWWVASVPYDGDIKTDLAFFDESGEAYRKIRNTLRYMLSNLYDFEPSCAGKQGHCVDLASIPPTSLEAWVLGEYQRAAHDVVSGYERYDYQRVTKAIYDFCNDTLSASYLAAIKDRLYCDAPDSPRRRRTQTVLWDLTDALCRLLAPVCPHTADEAFRSLWKVPADDRTRCVHLEEVIGRFPVTPHASWAEFWKRQPEAARTLEQHRKQHGLDNPLDAGLVLPDPDGALATLDPIDIADSFGVSRVSFDRAAKETRVLDLRAEPRCERSWKRDGTVRPRADGSLLSDRDARAVSVG